MEFPVIPFCNIPAGVLPVPVKILAENDEVYATSMIAGLVGITASEDQSTFQPRTGWWMVEETQALKVREVEEREEGGRAGLRGCRYRMIAVT